MKTFLPHNSKTDYNSRTNKEAVSEKFYVNWIVSTNSFFVFYSSEIHTHFLTFAAISVHDGYVTTHSMQYVLTFLLGGGFRYPSFNFRRGLLSPQQPRLCLTLWSLLLAIDVHVHLTYAALQTLPRVPLN